MFAQRTSWKLTPNRLTICLEDLRKKKTVLYDLTESNPTRCGFPYPQEKILNAFVDPKNLEYAPDPQGMHRAREALSALYRENNVFIDPEKIFLTASTSEGYSYLFRLLVDPGQGILFPRPSYPLFQFLGDLNDVKTASYPLVYKKNWGIDFEALRSTIHSNIKAIVLVNPNNPTGSFVKQGELDILNDLCQKQSLTLIGDEVFFDYAYEKEDYKFYKRLSHNKEVLTFVLGGLSKSLGLPQMKLSWIMVNGPAKQVEKALKRLEIIADTYLSVNTPVQNALPSWLELAKEIQGAIVKRIVANRDCLLEEINKVFHCEILNAEGGWYVILKIPNNLSEEDWTLEFLKKDHVLVHPGYFFDFESEAYMVVSLLPREEIFQEGLNRLLKRVETVVS